MVELLVSIALMSVMTAVLLQSFIVARRLNARASTEARLQTLAETTMESMEAAPLSLESLRETARTAGTVSIDGMLWHAESEGEAVRLICNDVGNGRGPVVSFGQQYGVYCLIDPAPYAERQRQNTRDRRELVASFNARGDETGLDRREVLAQLTVVVYRMDGHLAKSGEERIRLETARVVEGGAL